MAQNIGTLNTKGDAGEYVISVPSDFWENKDLYSIGADISGDDYTAGCRVQIIYNGRWTDISDRAMRCDKIENLNNEGKIRINITKAFNNSIQIYWVKEESTNEE